MIRVLVDRDGGLLDGEAHHLQVRRVETGETVELRDGEGLVGRGTVRRAGKSWGVDVIETSRLMPPPRLTLAVGAGDRDRFAWLVEKATELGVSAIVPLECERTAGVATRVRSQHLERLRRHALEAVKQSGAAWAPRVEEPTPLAALAEQGLEDTGWLADAEGEPVPAVIGHGALTAVIGPEGGLTSGEREQLRAAGYRRVRLGAHTLRFETAAIAAAAAAVAGRLRGSHD
jgi:16S rRNA (uracil1498-N3)-methyltransferase